ncbi:MAG: hypothetical protein K2X38_03975 [Gemmataceae bacterium]|nr:hypothetical protein [Gemmataceae bacterium]
MSNPQHIYTSRPIRPDLLATIEKLKPGDRIRITQTVRVGFRSWPAAVTGVFRHVDSMATGLATDRVAEDDIIVPILHFTKDNKEMSSVALDEQTTVEIVN